MDYSELFSLTMDDLQDRSLWETRQQMYYDLRHHGLRRKSKPWPGASDAHFPSLTQSSATSNRITCNSCLPWIR